MPIQSYPVHGNSYPVHGNSYPVHGNRAFYRPIEIPVQLLYGITGSCHHTGAESLLANNIAHL